MDIHLVFRRLVDIGQTYTEMLLHSDGKPGFNLAHTLLPRPLPEGSPLVSQHSSSRNVKVSLLMVSVLQPVPL